VRKFDSGGEFRELSGPDASEGSDFAEILKAPASNSTPASFEPVAAASSSDYVSFFDDFDNSLLTDDNDHEDYEQQLPSKYMHRNRFKHCPEEDRQKLCASATVIRHFYSQF
jgi:hypothetical protein